MPILLGPDDFRAKGRELRDMRTDRNKVNRTIAMGMQRSLFVDQQASVTSLVSVQHASNTNCLTRRVHPTPKSIPLFSPRRHLVNHQSLPPNPDLRIISAQSLD
jgi:hypothetical protein